LQAEELNAIVGNAFKMAFTCQRENQQQETSAQHPATPESADSAASPPTMIKQPTFHELIEQQIVVQREQNVEIERKQQEELTKRLSEISTTKIDERMKELMDRKKKEQDDLEKEQEAQRLQRLRGKDRTSWVC
jgi:predicted HTH domain antitoxin